MRSHALLALCLVVTPAAAYAQQSIYVGLGYGGFDYEEDQPVPALGLVSDTVSTYKLFGGFEVNDYFALEVAYRESDDIRQSGTENIPPFGDVTSNLTTDFTLTSRPWARSRWNGAYCWVVLATSARRTIFANSCRRIAVARHRARAPSATTA